MKDLRHAPLGHAAAYLDTYDAGLLFPIERQIKRQEIGIGGDLPFGGADIWNCYELSWLNLRGKPQIALVEFTVPCETPNIIESKSFKLYLNSFNQTCFADAASVQARLRSDVSEALWRGAPSASSTPQAQVAPPAVGLRMVAPAQFGSQCVRELDGLSLDRLDVACVHYTPVPDLLRTAAQEPAVTEVLCSQLLKSNCLVTGQPDWGSIQISYSGAPIDHEGLLQYLVSFRQHHEFHEQCVERIFMDIWRHCQPHKLAVYARYTRRGGLDINPFRTSYSMVLPSNDRTARQ